MEPKVAGPPGQPPPPPDPLVLEACARAAHEVNRAYCVALGDVSQPSWETAPDWQKTSAKNGVAYALTPGSSPKGSHMSWLLEKEKDGWKYGPSKDPEQKLHPCMLPYEQLPPEQRAKDALFVSTVRAVAEALRPARAPVKTA